MPQRHSDAWIFLVSATVAVVYGAIHFASVSVSELTKDTFEVFSLDAQFISFELQHRLMFSLIGLVLALSGGYLAKDYVHVKGLSGKLLTTFGDLRLWIVFLSAVAISGSVFYHAFVAQRRPRVKRLINRSRIGHLAILSVESHISVRQQS